MFYFDRSHENVLFQKNKVKVNGVKVNCES